MGGAGGGRRGRPGRGGGGRPEHPGRPGPASTLGASGTPGGDTGGAGAALKERATGLGGGGQGISPKEGVRIIPDEENNLLVVVAPPHEWNIISRILTQLDIMPRQVLNEVLIAEVRLTDDLKYGIEFLLGGTPSSTSNSTGTTTGSTNTSRRPGDVLRDDCQHHRHHHLYGPHHHLRGGFQFRGRGDV